MPAIDTFGMPTREANTACPACGVGSLVMKFDMQYGHMNRIACPVASCSYDVPMKEFQSTLTETMPKNCPGCGHGQMIRKTKDVDSKFMGWVECPVESCTYEASFVDFRTAITAAP